MDEVIQTGNWPDPKRPGVPLNPEVDGWHVCRHRLDHAGKEPWPARWYAEQRNWNNGGFAMPSYAVRADWVYVSPVRTDADVALAGEVGMRAGIEAAAKWHDAQADALAAVEDWSARRFERRADIARHRHCASSIRALTPPPSDALAAMVAEAEARGAAREREAVKHAIRCGHLHEESEDLSRLLSSIDHDAKRRAMLARATVGGEVGS